ncbi:hypothetical protein [Streptomyces sp. NPDC048282]
MPTSRCLAGRPVTHLQTAASVMCVVPILLVFLVAQPAEPFTARSHR